MIFIVSGDAHNVRKRGKSLLSSLLAILVKKILKPV